MNTKMNGAIGEAYVAEYFRKKHYKLVAMNYRCGFGEIDIIAAKRKKLLFVEVKLRKAGGITRPADAVGLAKQRRLRAAADLWLAQNPEYGGYDMSFTIAQLYTGENGRIEKIEFMEEAF